MSTKNAINSVSSTVTYQTDDDNVATPPTAGVIKVLGGSNINTVSSGNAITIDGGLATYFEPLASDPTAPNDGQVWYNTTTQLFKGAKAAGASAWSTKANFPHTSYTPQDGASGTSEESLNSGIASSVDFNSVYELLTDSWSNRSGRNNSVTGGSLVGETVDDALSFGGMIGCVPQNATEIYDELFDSWTDLNTLNTARRFIGGSGDSSDALAFAGRIDNNGCATYTPTDSTERYDGATWTNKAVLSATKIGVGGSGTGADTLCVGGLNAAEVLLNVVERYDGGADSWTTKAPLSAVKQFVSCSGPAVDALATGGNDTLPNGDTVVTEIYDGGLDSWAAGPNLNVSRNRAGNTGSSSTDALTCGASSATSPLPSERLDEAATIVTFTVV